MIQKPACLLPFIGILIGVNKKVRPCCVYDDLVDGYPGDLRTETISQIRTNKKWIEIKENLTNQKVIGGCELCEIREARTGWSLKKDYQGDGTGYMLEDWTDEKLQMIEFNGSNICNLACVHCSPKFSSTWLPLARKMHKINMLGYDLGPDDNITKSNIDLIKKNLDDTDSSKLQWITLKGGEPLLNEETEVILEYLHQKKILQNIGTYCTTNGTIRNHKVLWLLGQSKFTNMLFSVDGNKKLNPYIRWSKRNFATLENIENNISTLAMFPNIQMQLTTSVMIYNAFSLIDIRDWWLSLIKRFPNNVTIHKNAFENVVTTDRVSIRNLSDTTRQALINFYQNNQSEMKEFDFVINELTKDYLGNFYHNQWVDYTLGLDQLRGTSILDVEPHLTNELVKL